MSVRSGQSITVEFVTSSFSTGAATSADSTPAGTLVVNGTDNAAAVTITSVDVGRYRAAVTLPTLAASDVVELVVSATVGGVAGKAVVWRDTVAAAVAAATWDEPRSGHVTAGTFGATSEWTTSTTPAAIADAVWDEARSGHVTAGTFGATSEWAGGGGGTDWTSGERAQIRQALGVTGTTSATSGSGVLDRTYALLAGAGLSVTVSSPVPVSGGTVRLVQGDDYRAADGRDLRWTVLTSLDLSLAAVELSVYAGTSEAAVVLGVACTVSAVSGGYSVSADLTAADTSSLAKGGHRYEVIATLLSGHVVTLLAGRIEVTD